MRRRDILINWLAAAVASGAHARGASGEGLADNLPLRNSMTNATPTVPDLGNASFAPAGHTTAARRSISSKLGDVLSVKDFGATGDGVSDDTSSVQAAINSPSGAIYFPAGKYRVTDTIAISHDRKVLIGDGKHVTIIKFEPGAEAVCFSFAKGHSVLYQAAIKGFGFVGGTGVRKIGIRATDTSELSIEDIAMYPWKGATSIGIQLRGRELTRVHNVSLSADLPISIEDNPNSSIDLDHAHFSDCYLLPGKAEPCIKVQSGIYLTNVTFDGFQAWVGGAGGFYWNDVDSKATSLDLSFQNVRYEQAADSRAYAIAIRNNHQLQGLTIRNTNLGLASRGIYLRGCRRATLENVSYSSPKLEAVNIDGTCDEILFLNCFFQAGSTASMTALAEKWSLHRFPARSPLPSTAFWVAQQ